MVFGAVTAFLIPDWPATTKWLKDDERALGVVRLIEDAGEEEEDIDTKAAAKMAVKDYRVWLCVLGQVSGLMSVSDLDIDLLMYPHAVLPPGCGFVDQLPSNVSQKLWIRHH